MPASYENRPPIEPLRIYSREEAAEVLNVSLSSVKRLISSGQLRVSQPAGMRRIFITGQALLDLIQESELKPGEYVDEGE